MIPLTLRGMSGVRHRQSPRSGRPSVLLLSVLALLALACFPVLAQAEIQYEDEVQSVKVPPHKTQKPKSEPQAEKSTSPESGGSQPGGGNSSNGNGGSGPGGSSPASNPSTPGGNGGGQSNPGNSATGGQKPGSVQAAKENPSAQSPSSSTSSDGGSSPLVPILIAIALLAAISVGFVVMKQRRQGGDDGPTVSSPEPN